MSTAWRDALWGQFGAAIDMLENAVKECPDDVWGDRPGFHEFWYLVYHTLFFLDYYLSDSDQGFAPPAPFTLSELDPAGVLPDRVYSKEELLAYLRHGREKARAIVASLTDATSAAHPAFGPIDTSVAEFLMYSLRHVQHHAGQLQLLLRQRIDRAPRWVRRAGDPLGGA
ncbi:MAG: DinB family protein [Hyphomicrobiales bacterium]